MENFSIEILDSAWPAIRQLLLFTMIPFVWWFVTARENENFLFWVGLKKVRGSWKLINICIAIF